MCKHSSCLTPETCSICKGWPPFPKQIQKRRQSDMFQRWSNGMARTGSFDMKLSYGFYLMSGVASWFAPK